MESDEPGPAGTLRRPGPAPRSWAADDSAEGDSAADDSAEGDSAEGDSAEGAVAALYEEHALRGRALVVTSPRPGASAGTLRGGRYTPIPWSDKILAAAW